MREVKIADLRDGQRVLCGNTYHQLRRVWRYDDGRIVLEFRGDNPGLWSYPPEYQNETVTIR